MGEEGGVARIQQLRPLEIERGLKSGHARIEFSRDADEPSKIPP